MGHTTIFAMFYELMMIINSFLTNPEKRTMRLACKSKRPNPNNPNVQTWWQTGLKIFNFDYLSSVKIGTRFSYRANVRLPVIFTVRKIIKNCTNLSGIYELKMPWAYSKHTRLILTIHKGIGYVLMVEGKGLQKYKFDVLASLGVVVHLCKRLDYAKLTVRDRDIKLSIEEEDFSPYVTKAKHKEPISQTWTFDQWLDL